jgi:hypothetical protein
MFIYYSMRHWQEDPVQILGSFQRGFSRERDSQRILIEHTRSLEKWYDLLSPIESIFVSSNENETIEKEKRGEEQKKNSITIQQVYAYSLV